MKKTVMIFLLAFIMCFLNVVGAFSIIPLGIEKTESEPNNSIADANNVNQDDTIYGYITSSNDVDYYEVNFPLGGTANFWLGDIPASKNYNLYVYDSTGKQVGSSTGTSSTELVSLTVSANSTYYFKVMGYNGSYDVTHAYRVRSRLILNTYNYFCQNDLSLSSPKFSTTNLDILYYKTSSGGISASSWRTQIEDAGCVSCSLAMILRNLGAQTTNMHYDVRMNRSHKMSADPFTVTYANTLFPNITYLSDSKIYVADTTTNPVYTTYANVASGFGRSCALYQLSGSDTDKANAIAYQLSLHPEGVAVSFQNSKGQTHTIVFTSTTYETPTSYSFAMKTLSPMEINTSDILMKSEITEDSIKLWENSLIYGRHFVKASTYDNLFTVSDPVSTVNHSGNQVLFGESYTAANYSFGNAYRIIVIN